MKTLLEKREDINETESILRQLYKVDSKLRSDPVLAAFRENRRLIAILEKKLLSLKEDIKKETESKNV